MSNRDSVLQAVPVGIRMALVYLLLIAVICAGFTAYNNYIFGQSPEIEHDANSMTEPVLIQTDTGIDNPVVTISTDVEGESQKSVVTVTLPESNGSVDHYIITFTASSAAGERTSATNGKPGEQSSAIIVSRHSLESVTVGVAKVGVDGEKEYLGETTIDDFDE